MGEVRKRIRASRIMFYAITITYAFISIFPFIWAIYGSLKTRQDSSYAIVSLSRLVLSNYPEVFRKIGMLTYYKNSIIVAFFVTVGNLIINTLAGYALARIKFPGRNIFFLLVLGIMMIPPQILLIPNFVTLKDFGWINTYQGLIVPFLFNSFYIFMMRQFFLQFPVELEEAAFIDGMSRGGIFLKIAVPLVKPALAAQAIMVFVNSWNNFLWPNLIATKKNMFTLPVGLAQLQQQYRSFQNEIMTGVVCLAVPMIIVFLIFQRYIIENIATAGIKA